MSQPRSRVSCRKGPLLRWRSTASIFILLIFCLHFVAGTPKNAPSNDLMNVPEPPAEEQHLPGGKSEDPLDVSPPPAEDERSDKLYQDTIRHLSAIARKRGLRSSNAETRDLLYILTRLITRSILPRPLSDRLENLRRRHGPAEEDLGALPIESEQELDSIPVIEEGDEPAVKRIKATQILRKLGYDEGHQDSLATLGDMFLYGKYSHPRNTTEAFKHYHTLARKHGSAIGQRTVGLMYATGVGVDRDYAKALLYLSFAALADDTIAEQALGYWHWAGIATTKSCDDASFYFKRVAEKAVEKFRSGPPLGLAMPLPKLRLPDQEGGVYGYGASGPGDPNVPTRGQGGQNGALTTEDILQYYRLQADAGDPLAQLLIGKLFYLGTNNVKQNFRKAMEYFLAAASKHPGLEAVRAPDATEGIKQAASASAQAMGLLGQMYWRGEGVEQDNATARQWFERGAIDDNAACLHALGVMNMEGIAGPKDPSKGFKFIQQAAHKENPDAQAYLGELYLGYGKKEYQNALKWLQQASSRGHIVALYNLANMYTEGLGVALPNCDVGVRLYKSVAEKGDWHDPIVHQAQADLNAGDMEGAFLRYLFAAERGYEIAQTNAAWMLDRGMYSPSHSRIYREKQDPYKTALYLWNRAANQGNVNARVKMGDYYYYGLGTTPDPANEESEAPKGSQEETSLLSRLLGTGLRGKGDPERAAIYYQVAADKEWSSIAMWNLGWMHETGIGVQKDYHLAKRNYDMCLDTNPEAYLPVNLALVKLRIKILWDELLRRRTSSDSSSSRPDETLAAEKSEKRDKESWRQAEAPLGLMRDEDNNEFWEFEHVPPTEGDVAETIGILVLCAVAAGLVLWRQGVLRRVAEQAPPVGAVREGDRRQEQEHEGGLGR
ncbi:ubiquitin ligase complex subunit HRD3 [Spizellomyces punctatus DAOM BR117]|uniref:Uncharacterized protein n=1 Tax=Spizellomyces punctatus (strain DAOM BR117) TaxID=645134 RepID=A0A0L0HD22_SPIPD|nr:ubiquitin ligase complex subunit HRD3 [Spizellomyces punctatus DAOM BR117]KNC98906.1 hypothetical protein, variant [Spizellomyces punctatus DAOM BR117]|eukprot:XP_016606946.1 hypothetical protein, variant [Spizellomyces punctatus DAOM BR117]